MKPTLNFQMKAEYIYDLLLFQVYSKFSGFLVNLLGLTVIIIGGLRLGKGELTLLQTAFYLMAGFLILAYTPLQLKRKAKYMMGDEKNQQEVSYAFDENGIEEQFSENSRLYTWEDFDKVISTPKTITFFHSDSTAIIMPKETFGDAWAPVMQLILAHMPVSKILIR